MALIVEDGTGLATAESYISVAAADTYIADYKGADATWDAATASAKEVAARQATQYLDNSYFWKGENYSSTQSLYWPRNFVYDDRDVLIEGLPVRVARATAEVMFLIIGGADLTVNVTKADQTKREKVDVIEVEYFDSVSYQPIFPIVSGILGGLYMVGGRSIRG